MMDSDYTGPVGCCEAEPNIGWLIGSVLAIPLALVALGVLQLVMEG